MRLGLKPFRTEWQAFITFSVLSAKYYIILNSILLFFSSFCIHGNQRQKYVCRNERILKTFLNTKPDTIKQKINARKKTNKIKRVYRIPDYLDHL